MKFSFIAKHRGMWPADWKCERAGPAGNKLIARMAIGA